MLQLKIFALFLFCFTLVRFSSPQNYFRIFFLERTICQVISSIKTVFPALYLGKKLLWKRVRSDRPLCCLWWFMLIVLVWGGCDLDWMMTMCCALFLQRCVYMYISPLMETQSLYSFTFLTRKDSKQICNTGKDKQSNS